MLVQEAVHTGAISYLLKNVSGTVLVEAILAPRGQATLADEAINALMALPAESNSLGSDLTNRERKVLQLMVRGLTNFQIARQIGISKATVRFHVGNLLSKLEVSNRTEAVHVAIKHRLVE